jgi:hypothetical protein
MLYATAEANVARGNMRKYTEDRDLYSPPFFVGYAINGEQAPQ